MWLTPPYKVVKVEWSWGVEHVGRDLGVKVDALDEHPEDGGLEAEHEQGQDHVAQPGLALVPGRVWPSSMVDVGLEVEDGGQVQQHQGEHEVLVDPQSVTLQGSVGQIRLIWRKSCSVFHVNPLANIKSAA